MIEVCIQDTINWLNCVLRKKVDKETLERVEEELEYLLERVREAKAKED